MAQTITPTTVKFLGFEFPDNRYTNYHIIDYNNTWDDDVTKFAGFQNSFAFERAFIPIGNWLQEMTLKYWSWSFYISIGYIVTIFGIQHLMKNRQAFDLRRELILWNFLLAAFSILGTYRCLPEFFHIIYHDGLKASYTKSTYYADFRLSVWYLFFTLSKALELIDTLFIVLRKSKLIPLHWIHHLLTLNFSWFVFADVPATARWMVNMNFFVHSLMYTYYALKALKYRIPKQVNVTITTLQVTQMFAGLFINYECLKRKLLGLPADTSYSVVLTGFTLYGIFAVLFVNFFIRTYILPSKPIQILSDINHNHYKGVVKKCQ